MTKISTKVDNLLQWANDNHRPRIVVLISAFTCAISDYIDEIVAEKEASTRLCRLLAVPDEVVDTKRVERLKSEVLSCRQEQEAYDTKLEDIKQDIRHELEEAGADTEVRIWFEQYAEYKTANIQTIKDMDLVNPGIR